MNKQKTKHDLHIQWIRENYDSFTGKPKKEWVSESEWLKGKASSAELKDEMSCEKQN
jgi:hypothetical protein